MGWMKAGIAAGDMKLENGWLSQTKTGLYGTAYLQRALVTAIRLGANRPQDAVYHLRRTRRPEKYSGEKKYVMRLDKGQLPPVDGFWLLTITTKTTFSSTSANRFNVEPAQQAEAQP